MSYILDALQRAQAERTLGAVPGLHSQPMPALRRANRLAPSRVLAWVAVAGLVTAVLALSYGRWQTDEIVTSVPATSTPVPILATTPPSPAAPATANRPSVAPAPVPAPAPSSGGVRMPSVPLLTELPESLRRQLPTLLVTGSVYANDPGQRLLLLNNQVLPQGSEVAKGLVLQEIQTKQAVFSFQETRFRVPF